MNQTFSVACALAVFAVFPAHAEVKPSHLFADHMVLQRDRKLPIWGIAAPAERVTVEFAGQSQTVVADKTGRWLLHLDPLAASAEPRVMTITGSVENQKSRIEDVVVGEVWVGSGQSNMQMALGGVSNAVAEIAAANYPQVRMFTVAMKVSDVPLADVGGAWAVCTPATAGRFSAAGYFFSRDLHKTLGVPVGLIHTSWGGTPAEAWTSDQALGAEPDLKTYLDHRQQSDAGFPRAKERYEQELTRWKEQEGNAKAAGKPEPKPPRAPQDPRINAGRPAGLFNAMVAPLMPCAIRGVIWYQGESNASHAYLYRKLFPALIRSWREAWGAADPAAEAAPVFPFLFVQLANYRPTQPEPGDSDWAELREAQTRTLSLPRTGMAVAIDIGMANDIHPKNKQEVGRRLALAAEAIAYGQPVEYSGPMYEAMTVSNAKVSLRFTHTDGGLVAKGEGPLKGFAVAGADKKFVWASAEIRGDSVVVWNDQVPQPVAVRYAWANNPECNLFNKAGLPASPFRTDDWPGVTANSK